MLYQKMMLGASPYYARMVDTQLSYEKHRHPELELSVCLDGEFTIIIEDTPYCIKKNMMAIVGSMESHELYTDPKAKVKALTIEFGAAFLSNYYLPFSNVSFDNPVFVLDEKEHKELFELFAEIENYINESGYFSDLIKQGDLYKICAHIFKQFIAPFSVANESKLLIRVEKIERALEYIGTNYKENIKISEVAALCGYSDSNFCKHFKEITGYSFHNMLNRKRIENACIILQSTSLPLDKVASEVGFADSKSLCRIFKKTMGASPIRYRKEMSKKCIGK